MEVLKTVAHYIFSLGVSLTVIYAGMVMLESQLESRLLGRPTNPRFLNTFFRRVWIYWLLPGIFSFTGIGLVLFPNSKIQEALATVTKETLDKEGPYSQHVIQMLGLEGGTQAVILAMIVAILLVALARILIVTYSSAFFTTIYFYFLGAVGLVGLLMTLDAAERYVRLLVDYLVGDKFQTGIVLIAVGGTVGFVNEWFLANVGELRGWRVGQVPPQGAYFCKTCQRSQYVDGTSQLEQCPGRCTSSVFRRGS
jgi:hypothetical protein